MDKMTKILLIILASGIVLVLLGALLTKGNPRKLLGKNANANFIRMEYECTSPIDRIEVSELSERVSVTRGDVEYPTVVYYVEEEYDNVEVSDNGGTLRFKREHKPQFFFNFHIGINVEDTSTYITLPKSFDGELNISTSSGSIDASDIETGKDVNLSCSSGSMKVKKLSCANLNASCTSGSLKMEEVECKNGNVACSSGLIKLIDIKAEGDLSVKNTSGSINVSDAEAKGKLSAKNTSGGLKVVDSECSEFSGETNSGMVSTENLSAVDSFYAKATSCLISIDNVKSDKFVLKSTSGSIGGTIDGKESDYSIISSTTSGSCNLKDSRDGSKSLDASTTSGSIHISFK